MVDPIELTGRKHLCALVDKQDWASAQDRYHEIGIKIAYHFNRPVVNIEAVRIASLRWYRRKAAEKK